ncbi:MAG: LuxR C-terminal-related transcriptional regulator [Polyangiaceae bacterium]|nr:LuxR C-terminal-related transcriptional regulator [Polyangiaceae bacterium]
MARRKRHAEPEALPLAALRDHPPPGLEAVSVGPPGDHWVLLSWDEARAEASELPRALGDVLEGILHGEPNRVIAARRKTSVRTVDNQVATLLERFGAGSRVELVRKVLERRALRGLDGNATPELADHRLDEPCASATTTTAAAHGPRREGVRRRRP